MVYSYIKDLYCDLGSLICVRHVTFHISIDQLCTCISNFKIVNPDFNNWCIYIIISPLASFFFLFFFADSHYILPRTAIHSIYNYGSPIPLVHLPLPATPHISTKYMSVFWCACMTIDATSSTAVLRPPIKQYRSEQKDNETNQNSMVQYSTIRLF